MQNIQDENDWRNYLVDGEVAEYRALEADRARLSGEIRVITDRISRMRNTCCQRRRQKMGSVQDA